MVRCRPINNKEKANGSATCVQIFHKEKQVVISSQEATKNYTFDAVYADDSTQR